MEHHQLHHVQHMHPGMQQHPDHLANQQGDDPGTLLDDMLAEAGGQPGAAAAQVAMAHQVGVAHGGPPAGGDEENFDLNMAAENAAVAGGWQAPAHHHHHHHHAHAGIPGGHHVYAHPHPATGHHPSVAGGGYMYHQQVEQQQQQQQQMQLQHQHQQLQQHYSVDPSAMGAKQPEVMYSNGHVMPHQQDVMHHHHQAMHHHDMGVHAAHQQHVISPQQHHPMAMAPYVSPNIQAANALLMQQLPQPTPQPAAGPQELLPLLLDQIEAHILLYGRIL